DALQEIRAGLGEGLVRLRAGEDLEQVLVDHGFVPPRVMVSQERAPYKGKRLTPARRAPNVHVMAGFAALLLASLLGVREAPKIELPPGPEADAFGRVGPESGAGVATAWEQLDQELASLSNPWKAWAECLSAEAHVQTPDAGRRSWLLAFALRQG